IDEHLIMDQESYHYVKGVWMHSFFSDEAVLSAIDYKPQDGDVIIVTYPKCGTNWTTYIVHIVLSRCQELSSVVELRLKCPFIEMKGAGAALNPSRTGPIMTHLPLEVFPPMDNAKYIYVARNPYDCAVSYYHFIKGLTPKRVTDVSFESFLRLFFLSGKVVYGDYFDHLLPWYERRNDANVLFLTYEQLKADTKAEVLKIAGLSRLENMKLFLSETPVGVKQLREKYSAKNASAETMKNRPTEIVEMHEGSGFVRKGIVGDWKNYFTEEQIKATKEWIARQTQGSDVMTLWSDCPIP
ncbi:hypothetical protein MTO96_043063, partial [Rhipicephalus appendiculatus]